jgi:hypothetical protein
MKFFGGLYTKEMQAEIVAPTPVVEAVPAPVVTDSSPVAEITPSLSAGETAPAAAETPAAAAPLAGGETELEGGKKHRQIYKSILRRSRKKCPAGSLKVHKKATKGKSKGHWVAYCSRSKYKRRRGLAGGETETIELEGGRRRRSRSRSRSRR